MLSHSSLDDIDYNHKYSPSTRSNILSRRKRQSPRLYNAHRRKLCSKKRSKFADYNDQCAVCLDESKCDTKLFPCGHSFHGDCLIEWVKVQNGVKFNCPLCRRDIGNFVQTGGDDKLTQRLNDVWNDHYLCREVNASLTDTSNKSGKKALTAPVVQSKTVTSCESCDSCDSCQVGIDNADTHNQVELVDTNILPAPSMQASPLHLSVESDRHDSPPPLDLNDHHNDDDKSNNATCWEIVHKYLYVSRVSYYSSRALSALMTTPVSVLDICTDNSNDAFVACQHQDVHSTSPYVSNYQSYPQNNYVQRYNYHDEDSNKCASEEHNNSTPSDNNTHIVDYEFHWTNMKAGIMAGVCAGTTTYMVTPQIRALMPVLAESIPNVAMFFTSYECFKQCVFDVNRNEKTSYRCFMERFASAGMASTLACSISRGHIGGHGILPLRFAAFFGTFEWCKDYMNIKHDELNLVEVASSAAVGGLLSHAIYYPIVQAKTLSSSGVLRNTASSAIDIATTRTLSTSALYGGFGSSLSRFLPACVACSCAFEYSKRWVTNQC